MKLGEIQFRGFGGPELVTNPLLDRARGDFSLVRYAATRGLHSTAGTLTLRSVGNGIFFIASLRGARMHFRFE